MNKQLKQLFLIIFIFMATFCSNSKSNINNNSNTIIATALPSLAYFLEQIVQGHMKIITLGKEGQHLEDIDLSVRTAQKLLSANYYFSMGTPFEKDLKNKKIINIKKFINLNKAISLKYYSHDKHFLTDPHIWMSPSNMLIILKESLKYLVKLDKVNASLYQKNFLKLSKNMQNQIRQLQSVTRKMKIRQFLIFHPFLGYFAEDYHLKQIALEEEGKEVTLNRVKDVLDTLKSSHIQFIFTDSHIPNNIVTMLNKEYQLKIVNISPTVRNYCKQMGIIIKSFEKYSK